MKKFICSTIIALVMLFVFVVPSNALEFSDVNENDWYYTSVQHASIKGWIKGYGDGRFGPNDELTHSQAITIIARATGLEPTDANDKWYSGFVEAAYNAGYIDEQYDLESPISRYDVVRIITKAYDIDPVALSEREKLMGIKILIWKTHKNHTSMSDILTPKN